MRSEQRKQAEKQAKDHDDFSQKILKLEVQVETQQREIHLLKSMKKQIFDKIDKEVSQLKELKIKMEKKVRESEEKVNNCEVLVN